MTAGESAEHWESLPTKHCHACDVDVPEGAYCGRCGAALTVRRHGGPAWLRAWAHTAAPREHVLRPAVTTSLFPRLPRRGRPAFRIALVVVLALLVGLALLRWQPPLIGISALGLPLLFVLYLKESDAFRVQSGGTLAATTGLSIALGIGWALTTEAIWKRTYDDVLGTPMTTNERLVNLLAIPLTGVVLMLAPVVLARVLRPGARESLDGYAIGALAALGFTAAGVLTRAAPEFADGLSDRDIPMDALLTLMSTRGIAGPLTAAATGGLVGAALWFRPRTDPETVRHWYSATSPVPAVAITVAAYVALNGIDYAWISYLQIVLLFAVVTVLTVLALRVVLHCALLLEAPDEDSPHEPVLCPQCESVVPDMAFCANCGVAAGAASRTSRAARRRHRPTPVTEGR